MVHCPVELKNLEPFLARAKELKDVEPAISYWCAYTLSCTDIDHTDKSTTRQVLRLAAST